MRRELFGVCTFHSETGTEGGYWAFQDNRHIVRAPAKWGLWYEQVVWDADNPDREGKCREDLELFCDGVWRPLPDPMNKDPDYPLSSLFRGEERGDRAADQRLMKKYGFRMKYAADRMNERYGEGTWHLEDSGTAVTADGTRILYGGTPTTEPRRPYGVGPDDITRVTVEWEDGTVEKRQCDTLLVIKWEHEGLHILKDGDLLTIYDKKTEIPVWHGEIKLKQHPLFTEHAFGFWIHADQEDVERDTWAKYFFREYLAVLAIEEG